MGNTRRCFVVLTTVLLTQLAISCRVSSDCANNAYCDRGRCRCDEDHVGLGKYLCVPEETNCACISYGDPHLHTFERSNIDYVFPCTHVLARYIPDTCGPVFVYGTSVRRGPGISAVFESEVFWYIQRGFTSHSGRITTDGIFLDSDDPVSLPTTLQDSSLTIHLSRDRRGYFTVSSPDCQTHIAFHNSGVITVAAPMGHTTLGNSACGVCGDGGKTLKEWAKEAFESPRLSLSQKKAAQLTSELSATIDGHSGLCSNLSQSTSECDTDTDVAHAAQTCMELVDPRGIFRQCLGTSAMADSALSVFARCVTSYCEGDTGQACAIKAEFGLECSPVVQVTCGT